jgi:eukaryotic-like serine/threonine-protein kinase
VDDSALEFAHFHSTDMFLGPGARLGPYEIQAAIGAGGMGEVYRARDTRLKREVALKILPQSFASDPDRLARFQREAEVLASLNHPNIAAIHGLEEADGTRALVMELVEGETLADRIARGAMPLDEALPLAKQIAEALEAAHEQGIIHRDLKPANIKLRPDGTVKVLDFGLAKLNAPNGANVTDDPNALSLSPTITSPAMTGVGMLLGTAAYMSPEQAKGTSADKRSDIWAFGCVLYEMLTGRRCFDGEDVADTLAFILTKQPDWSALPPTMPTVIGTLLRRSLEKDRRKRPADIAAALFAIDEAEASATGIQMSSAAVVARPVPLWRRLAMYSAPALLAGAAIASGALWFATRPTPPRVVQFTLATTPATALAINGGDRDLAITPDGSRIVYVGNNGSELFVRPLGALEAVSLYKGGAPRGPFVSPDGQWVGFIDNLNTLKKVAITGGPAVTVAPFDGVSRGAVWMPDDTIVFATASPARLQRTPAGGGAVKVLTRPDNARGEAAHLWPEMLPGGRAVMFTIVPTTGGLDAAQIAVFDLQTLRQTVVVRGGSHAHYVASGHLVYAAGGTLRAIAFDPIALMTRGTSVPVVAEVVTTGAAPAGGVDAVVSNDGTLAYVRGTGSGNAQRTLVWVDRQGRETAIAAPPRAYVYPRISPDGGRLLVYAADQEFDLWVWDVVRLTLTRLTFTPGNDNYPVWTPDGRRLLFTSDWESARNLSVQPADGTGVAKRLTTSPHQQNATAITPDGTRLLFTETTPQTGDDVMQLELMGNHTITPLVHTPAAERNGMVSPDGRWLAYEANDSGSFEIYVRPYPNVASGRGQVSTGGGTRPLWSRDGTELFYMSPGGAILRVGIEQGTSWAATTPSTIIKEGYAAALAGFLGRTYDISPDGQQFLVFKSEGASNAPPPQLIVVQHFDEMLKRLVPAN